MLSSRPEPSHAFFSDPARGGRSSAPAARSERHDGWRGDVEGLRAFAIVPVVLFHLDRSYAPGGFLGVDLFLVISGYLITRMLLADSYLDSPAGVRRFLHRRFLRIGPALAATVAAFSLCFALVALPRSHDAFFLTGVASLFGVSNVVLMRASTDYFAPAASHNPFLHTWSVSLEDQFYLVYVLILFLLARVTSRRHLAVVIAGATLVAAEYAAFEMQSSAAAFFRLDSRIWEFLIGACAWLLQRRLTRRETGVPAWVGWLGIVAVLWCLAAVTERGARFVHYAILCAGCAAVLIRPVQQPPGRLGQLLAHPALRAVGRRSFAIYLVHFPLLKLFELFTDAGGGAWFAGLAYVCVTALAAEALHRGVERPYVASYREPVRTPRRARPRAGLLWAGAAACAVASLWAMPRVSLARGLAPRLARDPGRALPTVGQRELVLIGDSFAEQLLPALHRLAIRDSLLVVSHAFPGCLPSEDLTFVRDGMPHSGCQALVRSAVAGLIATPRPDRAVLIAMRAPVYLSPRLLSRSDLPVDGLAGDGTFHSTADGAAMDAYVVSLGRTVARLGAAGVPVLFLAPLPEMRLPPHACFFNPARAACAVTREEELAYRAAFMDRLQLLASEQPTFTLWDPFDKVCPEPACTPFRGAAPVYSDDSHLSAEMVVSLAPDLARAIDRALARSP